MKIAVDVKFGDNWSFTDEWEFAEPGVNLNPGYNSRLFIENKNDLKAFVEFLHGVYVNIPDEVIHEKSKPS